MLKSIFVDFLTPPVFHTSNLHKSMYFLTGKTIPMFVFSQNLIFSLHTPKMKQKKFCWLKLKNNILNVESDILDKDQSKVQETTILLITVSSSFHSFRDKIGKFEDEKSTKATLAKRFICAKYRTAKNY